MLIVAFVLFTMASFLVFLHQMVKYSPRGKRIFIRTWVLAFALEMIVILCLEPEQMHRLGFHKENGFHYWIAFTYELSSTAIYLVSGDTLDYWALLLVPVVPALAAYRLQQP